MPPGAPCVTLRPVTDEELLSLPLPARIREARKSAGYTSQDAFAEALGMPSRRQVSRWETGKNAPEEEYAEKIADVTKRPVELFTTERGATPSEPEYERMLREVLDLVRSGTERLLQVAPEIDARLAAIEARLADPPDSQANGGTQ